MTRHLPLALVWLCLPAAALGSTGSVYLLPDTDTIHLSDDGSSPTAVLLAAGRADNPTGPASAGARSPPSTRLALEIGAAVAAASRRYGVSASLIRAVIDAESGFRPHAVSPRGALGLMQLMPETARSYGVSDPFDIESNVDAGTRHLRRLIERFGSDTRLVLAAYNAGAEAVARFGNRIPPYAETLAYVPRVLQRLAALGDSDVRAAVVPATTLPTDPAHP